MKNTAEIEVTAITPAQFGTWITGTCEGLTFEAKVFDGPSDYGIDGGRISILEIRDNGRIVVSYCRGWGSEPDAKYLAQYGEILGFLNEAPVFDEPLN